jgi:hypothetical protein
LDCKARPVAGDNWTVNDKEDIYSGVVRLDTIRIGFFLGELYALSCCACDTGNTFLYGKTKEKVYITAGLEFGPKLCRRNLIINMLPGRFDIAYATSAIRRFNLAPREGHLKAVKSILACLKTFPKGRVIVNISFPNHSEYLVDDLPNWKDFYPDAEEEIPNDLPMSKGLKVRVSLYVDADHDHDLVNRRSITGIKSN